MYELWPIGIVTCIISGMKTSFTNSPISSADSMSNLGIFIAFHLCFRNHMKAWFAEPRSELSRSVVVFLQRYEPKYSIVSHSVAFGNHIGSDKNLIQIKYYLETTMNSKLKIINIKK